MAVPTPPVPPMSAAVRAVVYSIYAWVSVVLTLAVVGFAAADADIPVPVTVALAVVPAFGAAVGFLAKDNVTPDDEDPGDGGPV